MHLQVHPHSGEGTRAPRQDLEYLRRKEMEAQYGTGDVEDFVLT